MWNDEYTIARAGGMKTAKSIACGRDTGSGVSAPRKEHADFLLHLASEAVRSGVLSFDTELPQQAVPLDASAVVVPVVPVLAAAVPVGPPSPPVPKPMASGVAVPATLPAEGPAVTATASFHTAAETRRS